jgi:hypothetical protein
MTSSCEFCGGASRPPSPTASRCTQLSPRTAVALRDVNGPRQRLMADAFQPAHLLRHVRAGEARPQRPRYLTIVGG